MKNGGLAGALLAHFDTTRRDMPWRATTDPYGIWVSEVMLQQTRVETVIPYYDRWIRQFPTVGALADASEQDVLRAWEGLGYYSRARNLHAAARVVRETHTGRVPDTVEGLLALPGIGEYTAGAVASIAYGRAVPAIDGNARRVFSRLLDRDFTTVRQVQREVGNLIPLDRPGDFNQAIMELGATVCTPRPRCSVCPLRAHCIALRNGTVAQRPCSPPRAAPPVFHIAVAVLIDPQMRTLLVQRPEKGLLAGFWTFPAADASSEAGLARAARRLAATLTSPPPRARRLAPMPHTFSHRIEIYHPFVYQLKPTAALCNVTADWVDAARMAQLPIPVAQRRVAKAAGLTHTWSTSCT